MLLIKGNVMNKQFQVKIHHNQKVQQNITRNPNAICFVITTRLFCKNSSTRLTTTVPQSSTLIKTE